MKNVSHVELLPDKSDPENSSQCGTVGIILLSTYYLHVLDNILWGVLQCLQSSRADAKDSADCNTGQIQNVKRCILNAVRVQRASIMLKSW